MKLYPFYICCLLLTGAGLAEDPEPKDEMKVEYRSSSPWANHGVTMAGALEALGVTLDKIDYLQLVGDESGGTPGLSKKTGIDQEFWNRYFERAEPYKFWVPSGNRRLEIYLKGESKPKTTIYINETDSCTAEGDLRGLRYMCWGLHQWFEETLDVPKANAAVASTALPVPPEFTVKVFNPSDESPRASPDGVVSKPVVYDHMKPLIRHLQEVKPPDFIKAAGAKETLSWRIQHINIISENVLAAKFTEGHIEVIGIFVHNAEKDQWDLATEIGGSFKTKVYDETTGEPKREGHGP
jgi:hypothetical protein